MTLFNYMDEHEQIKNLHNRINNLKSIDKSHQKLNGELREEVKSLRNDMKLKDKEIGRMMKTEDLYGMLELLTSKRSDYINGSSIVMDGGYSAW